MIMPRISILNDNHMQEVSFQIVKKLCKWFAPKRSHVIAQITPFHPKKYPFQCGKHKLCSAQIYPQPHWWEASQLSTKNAKQFLFVIKHYRSNTYHLCLDKTTAIAHTMLVSAKPQHLAKVWKIKDLQPHNTSINYLPALKALASDKWDRV